MPGTCTGCIEEFILLTNYIENGWKMYWFTLSLVEKEREKKKFCMLQFLLKWNDKKKLLFCWTLLQSPTYNFQYYKMLCET